MRFALGRLPFQESAVTLLELRFLDEANADFRRIYQFLFDLDPLAATRAVAAILADIDLLLTHPDMGMIRPNEPEFRKWVVTFGQAGYVIDYRFDETALFINRIWHSREDRL